MASFRDYTASKTARVELFHGESLQVRQLTSTEFMMAALPFHRERLELDKAGKLTPDEDSRTNLATAFALVESWTFDEPLTLENFTELLKCPELSGIAARVIQSIDKTAGDPDAFVAKKSQPSSTGSGENGISTDQPEQKASNQDAKA